VKRARALAIGAVGAIALGSLLACSDDPLPMPATARRPEPCFDLRPPPVLILNRPTDPSRCLSSAARQRGVSISVEVTRNGVPTAVEQVYDLCIVVGRDGRPLPDVGLDEREKACILEHLRSWRFGAFDTCARQEAVLDLPLPPDHRAAVGRERSSGQLDDCGRGGRTRR
jgi:hypothetical protein